MKLKELLIGLDGIKAKGNLDKEINHISNDSRQVGKDDLFIAIKGYVSDGHKYLQDVIDKGASVIVVQNGCANFVDLTIPENLTIISLPDTRIAMSKIASNFYDNPARKLKIIGITGTKGKTTTSFMIKEILEKAGHKVGLIGTIATYINGKKKEDSSRTTPESIELHKVFKEMVDEGTEFVVMEVSSQSLKLHRVDDIPFRIGLFTNFSQDHISEHEHPDMEDYFNSKMKIFGLTNLGIVNADDLQCSKIPKLLNPDYNLKTYGIDNHANIVARDITITNSYVDFRVRLNNKTERIKVGIPGRFSVYNALAAISVVSELGISSETIKEALENIKVPGRSELVDNKLKIPVMVDYAHSPESLKNILEAVKSYTRGKVISVFGCGGDRDNSKRAKMGEISGQIADFSIITSDNPRTEEPHSIIEMIEEGMKKTNGKYISIDDRTQAIEYALKMATPKDIIVLAGKGHEPYQEINGVKHPYDERIIVKDLVNKIMKEKKSKK